MSRMGRRSLGASESERGLPSSGSWWSGSVGHRGEREDRSKRAHRAIHGDRGSLSDLRSGDRRLRRYGGIDCERLAKDRQEHDRKGFQEIECERAPTEGREARGRREHHCLSLKTESLLHREDGCAEPHFRRVQEVGQHEESDLQNVHIGNMDVLC